MIRAIIIPCFAYVVRSPATQTHDCDPENAALTPGYATHMSVWFDSNFNDYYVWIEIVWILHELFATALNVYACSVVGMRVWFYFRAGG